LEINGVYVENLRKKLGLSQDDFANLLGDKTKAESNALSVVELLKGKV
jgi:DNA-binding transcriptional regulator YiaG